MIILSRTPPPFWKTVIALGYFIPRCFLIIWVGIQVHHEFVMFPYQPRRIHPPTYNWMAPEMKLHQWAKSINSEKLP